jgi:hypothetical protein
VIYLDNSVALAHRLAENRYPPDRLWESIRAQAQEDVLDASFFGRPYPYGYAW